MTQPTCMITRNTNMSSKRIEAHARQAIRPCSIYLSRAVAMRANVVRRLARMRFLASHTRTLIQRRPPRRATRGRHGGESTHDPVEAGETSLPRAWARDHFLMGSAEPGNFKAITPRRERYIKVDGSAESNVRGRARMMHVLNHRRDENRECTLSGSSSAM